MYIKQIIIQGFKSYKEQTVIEPFSPGTNVIVGRNGSGKSNFFAAIRFVLSDGYTQLGREDRQRLLHEGSGSAVMSAFVEIIFDNSDGRFHTENKEVVIRRTISLKKDEYAIDRKVVSSRNEVFSMLEMAGFSRVNQYYIVPQGKVTTLTNMKETERLKLLKEIAGTESYEARRTESRKIMNETISKREKIDELLKDVKERLDELEEEKEELRGYQSTDRERRCLEYAYHHQRQEKVTDDLERFEQARRAADSGSESQKLYEQGQAKIAQMDSRLQELKQSLDSQTTQRRQLLEDRREMSRFKAQAELKVKHLADTQQSQDLTKQQHDEELANVRAEIEAKVAELAELKPEFNKRKDKDAKVKARLDAAKAGQARLFDKQAHSHTFKTKAARNAYLQSQIDGINQSLAGQKALRIDVEETIRESKTNISKLEKEIEALRNVDSGDGLQQEISDKIDKATELRDRLHDEQMELRREAQVFRTKLEIAKKEKDSADRKLANSMDRGSAAGLETMRRLKSEQDIPGAYGMLADLMEVSDRYLIPVEQVAGASLFNYIVDTDDTADELIKKLDKTKAGRLTFIPLSKLRDRQPNMPRDRDVFPLLSRIRYDQLHEKAFRQVFGKSLVCPDLAVAAQYSRSHGVDGITMNGDMTNKRGTMTGGYVDPTASRLTAVREARRLGDEYDKLSAAYIEFQRQIELKEQEITAAEGEGRKLQEEHKRSINDRVDRRKRLQQLEHQREQATVHRDYAVSQREVIDKDMAAFGESMAGHEAEMASDFKKMLTAQEEKQLEDYGAEADDLQKQYADSSKRRLELERRMQSLDSDLKDNLRLRENQLANEIFETATAAAAEGNYGDAQKELKKVQKRAAELDGRMQQTEAGIQAAEAKIAKIDSKKAQAEQDMQDLALDIERQQKRMEKGLHRKALWMRELDEVAKQIRDLGVLPEEAFEKYQRMAADKIRKKLETVKTALKKYKHVNKKAFEQYNSFTAQQEQLVKRRRELDSSQQSIEELVNHLDQKKDEAIERTFKQVSKEFAQIFERLVPAGHGRLVIQRRADRNRQQQPAEDSDEEGQRNSVENYTGVGISVSFNSKEFDEQQKIQQLSGGQKSLCALCLIFAIQATESSPMVVFDEVDANLDAQYRTAVASLLQSTSREAGTQFICTTFRPEIVLVADKCYGVTFTNKTSSIDCVPTESALSFVEGQQKP